MFLFFSSFKMGPIKSPLHKAMVGVDAATEKVPPKDMSSFFPAVASTSLHHVFLVQSSSYRSLFIVSLSSRRRDSLCLTVLAVVVVAIISHVVIAGSCSRRPLTFLTIRRGDSFDGCQIRRPRRLS